MVVQHNMTDIYIRLDALHIGSFYAFTNFSFAAIVKTGIRQAMAIFDGIMNGLLCISFDEFRNTQAN
ncbi:hypothetical protein MAM1_0059d03722 [Mucor ambiguus]|uniref:Uncharacterized protein n=1 Tax=Mucor ambiguus TaxID=91626 RepID=A0A0C9MME1_9FUNG|nr:hypothetical protein MAM1_0059d03722 [Mucor ambiguus]